VRREEAAAAAAAAVAAAAAGGDAVESTYSVGEDCLRESSSSTAAVLARQSISRGVVQHWDDLEVLWCATLL
jgi:hypothetical protein